MLSAQTSDGFTDDLELAVVVERSPIGATDLVGKIVVCCVQVLEYNWQLVAAAWV